MADEESGLPAWKAGETPAAASDHPVAAGPGTGAFTAGAVTLTSVDDESPDISQEEREYRSWCVGGGAGIAMSCAVVCGGRGGYHRASLDPQRRHSTTPYPQSYN